MLSGSCLPVTMVFLVVLSLLLLMYISFDVNYFIRTILLVACGKYFKPKKSVLDTTSIHGKHPAHGNHPADYVSWG